MPENGSCAVPRHIFTAPWEPVLVRRGDALGLRALADGFAETVAPQLSNRINDGRWVTIMEWCLVRSQEMFHAGGGRGVVTQAEARARYAWLRPLELMWVARTIGVTSDGGEGRPLSGKRRVAPWYNSEGKREKRINSFSLLLGGVPHIDMGDGVSSDEDWRNKVIGLATKDLKASGGDLRAREPGGDRV